MSVWPQNEELNRQTSSQNNYARQEATATITTKTRTQDSTFISQEETLSEDAGNAGNAASVSLLQKTQHMILEESGQAPGRMHSMDQTLTIWDLYSGVKVPLL